MATKNKEGIRGWFSHVNFGAYRISYISMRITGVALLIFFVYHVIQTENITDGRIGWIEAQKIFFSTEWKFVLVVIAGITVFHTLNGIRLIFTQSGHGIGKPRSLKDLAVPSEQGISRRPPSINKKNRLCIYASIGTGALIALFAFDFLFSL